MARNATGKIKDVNGAAEAADAPAPESLDKVRDILFGGQMRAVEARLHGMEDRWREEQTSLRNEFARRLTDLDGTMRKEIASLGERLAAERTKRAEELKALNAELRESLKNLERRHQKLEEANALADADLRDQLVKSNTSLSTDLARTADRLSGELSRVESSLRGEKLDTAALAAALTEMSNKLTATGRPGGKGGPRA